MSIEAMSKAYEALNKSRPFDADNARMQRDAMDALRTAIQQSKSKHRHWSEALADDLAESDDIQTDTHPAIQQAESAEAQTKTGEPVGQAPSVWNSIQIASWIGSQLMREPSMFERNAVCKFVRSLGRHPTLLKHSPKDTHPAPGVPDGWTDADADAARLAMELECLLLDTKDTAAVSRWWKSANEALDLHRARLAAAQAQKT